jgi:hypothetical protein
LTRDGRPGAREARARIFSPRGPAFARVDGMGAIVAKVQDGHIRVDEATDLPDGTVVRLYLVDEGDDLDEECHRVLDDAIDQAAESAARGEAIPADDVLRLLDADG